MRESALRDVPLTVTCSRSPPHASIEPTSQDINDGDIMITQPVSRLSPIDVDAMDDTPSSTPQTCCGIEVKFPQGGSAHSSYPYGIHDELGDPWDYAVTRGVMILRAKGCTSKAMLATASHKHGQRCDACDRLTENGNLQGVLRRIENGVHENTHLMYHSIGGLVAIARTKTREIRALRLRKLNDAQKLTGKAVALDNFKQWVMAVGSGKVERVDRLVKVNLARKGGIQNLLDLHDRAARQVYHPRNYTEEDDLRGLLLWRLGGARVAGIAHRALHLPSLSTLRRRTIIPRLLVSSLSPSLLEVETNVSSNFESICKLIQENGVTHQVLMLDELKTEERLRHDDNTNKILGVCREHGNGTSLEFNSEKEVDLLIDGVDNNEVHLAVEVCGSSSIVDAYFSRITVKATVGALGVLSGETRFYSARPILISGSCKRETGIQHAALISTALSASQKSKLRTISIASDGESRRGEALIHLTFRHQLAPTSPIHDMLRVLPLMNLEVGEDDITADKDYKHIFKRLRNLLLRDKGLDIHGVHIKPAVVRSHFASNNLTSTRIDYLLNPNDRQDVKLAYDMLQEIWSLPNPPTDALPGFRQTRNSFHLLGALFRHILIPYICVDLSLSEQLEHLSAASHLLLGLFSENKATTKLMPTQLYIDIMIMVKNVYFCVAKAKVDDPHGNFWIILLGTDRLEVLFGILRTMVGNDANLDLLQLGLRLTGTTEVSTVLAKYPHWDRAPRRLKLPAISRDGLTIHQHVDHVNPASWRGNVKVSRVILQTCWKLGRRRVEEDFPFLIDTLRVATEQSFDIFSPLGEDLVKGPRDADDYDDTLVEGIKPDAHPAVAPSPSPDLEDAVAEELPCGRHSPYFELDGKDVYKARYLNQAFSQYKKTGSTDRLKRVASIQRYAVKLTDNHPGILECDPMSGDDQVQMDLPVASLVRCRGHIFLCIGEVNDIIVDNQHTDHIAVEYLAEQTVVVSYQMLYIVPAKVQDDPNLKNDWRWSGGCGLGSHRVPGCLIQPINPNVSTQEPGNPFYVFESSVLMAIGEMILGKLESGNGNLVIPEVKESEWFPYREETGK